MNLNPVGEYHWMDSSRRFVGPKRIDENVCPATYEVVCQIVAVNDDSSLRRVGRDDDAICANEGVIGRIGSK